MKTTILAIVAFAFISFLFACNQKKALDTKMPAQEEAPKEQQTPPTETADDPKKRVYQAIGYRKTACFGKCPTFRVKFFSDGRAEYNGTRHVDKIGTYEAQLEGKMLKDMINKAHEVGYLDFENEYPIEHKVADLPSTITYLRIGDMEKTIKNTLDGPKGLAEYEAYLEKIIDQIQWKATTMD